MATRLSVLHRRRRRDEIRASRPCAHPIWIKQYYGDKCATCDLFYPHGCAPWEDQDEYPHDDWDDEGSGDCYFCGGEGYIDGYEDDPLWFEPGETERCSSCGGSGLAKDMTIFGVPPAGT